MSKEKRKLSHFWLAMLTFSLCSLSQSKFLHARNKKKLTYITIHNKTATTEHKGKLFKPDDLHALFFENLHDLQSSCIEAKSLEARLLRVLINQPKIVLTIPDRARFVQIRSLFDSHNKSFASTDFIQLSNNNMTICITGPEKQKDKSELKIKHEITKSE